MDGRSGTCDARKCNFLIVINARKNADRRFAKLQLPLYTYLGLYGKQTNGGGSGWSIEGRKKCDELLLAVKAD